MFGFTKLLAILICLAAAIDTTTTPVSSQPQAVSTAAGRMLQGQVEHHEKLPPLDADLQAGVPFAESSIQKKGKYASRWIKIPSWFAGTFQTDGSYIESAYDYATRKTVQVKQVVSSAGIEQRGQQKDSSGEIWHFYFESGTSKSDQGDRITYNTIDWYGPEVVTKDRVVMRVQATSLVVDKSTGVIVDSFQREDLKTYVPRDANTIAVKYTSKSFDSRGLPRDLQTGRSLHRRIAPFTVLDRAGDYDYATLFRDYQSTEHAGR